MSPTRVRRIGRRKLATAVGVTPAAITHMCQPDGRLRDAATKAGIDIDHPALLKWLKSKKVSKTTVVDAYAEKPKKKTPDRPPRAKQKNSRDIPDDPDQLTLEQLQRLKVGELRGIFGSPVQLKDWLEIAKKHADTKEKELKNRATESKVIDRELVRTAVFGMLEAVNQRLLGDAPKTIASKLLAIGAAGGTQEEAEAAVRDVISSQLKPAVNKASKALRG